MDLPEFRSATELLQYVTSYLDGLIGKQPSSIEEAANRAKTLLLLRDEMLAFHFNHPRFAVGRLAEILNQKMAEMDKAEIAEILPELRAMRYTYELRKNTYERARAAYIANRAAERIMRTGVGTWLLPYLPYGGEYLAQLERYGGTAILVFRDAMRSLGAQPPQTELNLDGEVEEKPAQPGMLGDRTSTEVLLSALVRRAAEEHAEDIEREIRAIPHIDRVLEYEQIVRRYPLDKLTERPDLLWDLLSTLEAKGFLKGGDIDPDVIEGLRRKRSIKYNRLMDYTMSGLSDFLYEYYMLTSSRERRSYPVFHGLPPSPEPVVSVLGDRTTSVRQKMLLEQVLSLPSKHVGLALMHMNDGIPIKDLAERFGVTEEKLQRAVDAVRTALNANERVRRFMDFLGGERG